MRALMVALAATLTFLSTLLTGSPAHALTAPAYESEAVGVTNTHRTTHDLRRLRTDRCLTRFADRQAARMAAEQRIWHQDLSRVLRRCHLSRVGENVASGFTSGRTMVSDGWMRSPGHRDNILTRPFRIVAVGAARSASGDWYAAQVFGRR